MPLTRKLGNGRRATVDGGFSLCPDGTVTSFANPIIDAGVTGLGRLFADRAVTPVEACQAYLSRIDGLDGALNAYVALDAERALTDAHASAERWKSGEARSLLDGAPIAVKANIAVEGLPWHAGIGAYRDRMATADAACVAKLREHGAVILGLVNMHEGAFGGTTDNHWFGKTHNPWRHGYTAGGSSGGSGAAVAAGLCAGALGTDTLGSVRIPASYCGVYGHKPTQGLISTEGVIALSWTLDHVGVLARSAQDCACLMASACGAEAELAQVIAQPANLETLRQSPIAAIDWGGRIEVEPEVARAFERAVQTARAAGLTVEMLALPDYDFDEVFHLGWLISAAESQVEHAEALKSDPGGFSPMLHERLALGASANAADLARGYRRAAAIAEGVREAMSPYAAILMPTTPQVAFPFERGEPAPIPYFTAMADILGLPAAAFPTGATPEGLPLSVQALAWDDETSLGLAELLGHPPGAPPDYRG